MGPIKHSLPNLITLGRLILVPVIVWCVLDTRFGWAFGLFVFAGLSDAADGYLAKRWGVASPLGAMLDPIADKALLVSVLVLLGWNGHLAQWYVILAVSRDLLLVGGVVTSWMHWGAVTIRPLLISKANTVAQIALIGYVLASLALSRGGPSEDDPVLNISLFITAALTLGSSIAYLQVWVRALMGLETTVPGTFGRRRQDHAHD